MPPRRDRLASRRQVVGYSQEGLAEAIGVDRSTIVRWERGETTPLPWNRPRLAEALKVSVEDVAVLLDNSDGAVVVAERVAEPEAGSLPLAGLLIRQRRPGPGDLVAVPATPTDYGGLAIHAENLLQHFLSLEAEVGGDQLYSSLAGHVERMAPVIDEFPRPLLLNAFAQLCQMTGWLALDANRHSVARQYLSTAVLAAHQADEPALAASSLAYMSLQETYREYPQRALALAQTACDVASGSGTPRTNTMLATRLARAYARIGNRQESLAAIGRAERAFATAGGSGQPEPLWLSYVDQREVAAQKGACYLDLGMPDEAITALTEALRLLDRHTPTHARDRAHYLSRLAKCHLLAGDLDQACATAHEALDSGWMLGSARVVERLGEFHAALTPYAVHRDVRVFRDRFSTFIQR